MLRWRVCLLQQQCSNLLTGVYLWLLIAAITPARDHAASSTQTAAAKASIWLFAKPPGVLARQQGWCGLLKVHAPLSFLPLVLEMRPWACQVL